jgi:hypothetical protein
VITVDGIAKGAGLSPEDRAARARPSWEAYSRRHGGMVRDLIADLLHLVALDGGDPEEELDRAVAYVTAEADDRAQPGT